MGSVDEKEKFIHILIHDYAEKIFYFCIKKTSNEYDAEDLTSDILLNIITALEKGIVPEHFSAWIWKIARNRYSTWADNKRRRTASELDTDISELEIEEKTSYIEERELRYADAYRGFLFCSFSSRVGVESF